MKALIAVVVSLIGNIFSFFVGKSVATNKIKAQLEEEKNEYQQAGYEAAMGGVEKENKIKERGVKK